MSNSLILTYVLTYGGALASLYKPYIGLLIYIAFAILRPESLWYWAVPPGNYSRIVAIALLVGWAIQGMGNWKLGRAGVITALLCAFWGWSVVSAAQAPHQEKAWGYVEDIAKIVLPFVVGITLIDSMSKIKQLAWVIVISQGYVAWELNQSYFNGFNRAAEIGFGGIDNNGLAISMDACIGLSFFLALYSERWWQKVIALGCALLMVHVVLMSMSRGGMLALVITSGVIFLLIPKSLNHYLVFGVAFLVGVRLAGEQVLNRFFTIAPIDGERDWSAQSRLDLWSDCLSCLSRNPLLGCGPGNWGEFAVQFGWEHGKSAHTTWLEVAVELGVPGVLFLALFYLVCIWYLLPYVKESTPVTDPGSRMFARMTIASFVGFMISAQFVSVVGLEGPYYIALIGAGVLKVASLPGDGVEAQPCAGPHP